MGEKRRTLNWKCNECKHRHSIDDLEELGFVERFGNNIVVECSECSYQELIRN